MTYRYLRLFASCDALLTARGRFELCLACRSSSCSMTIFSVTTCPRERSRTVRLVDLRAASPLGVEKISWIAPRIAGSGLDGTDVDGCGDRSISASEVEKNCY